MVELCATKMYESKNGWHYLILLYAAQNTKVRDILL
jgi:hypothetical protein